MTRNSLSIFNELKPYTVGFDNAFDIFERMFENDFKLNGGHMGNYPPYDIVRTGDYTYNIQLALAGFGKKDIEVEVTDGTLTVRSVKEDTSETDGEIYRGISYRKFDRKFTLADDIVVNNAELENGMLKITLERVIPEHKKPRLIEVM